MENFEIIVWIIELLLIAGILAADLFQLKLGLKKVKRKRRKKSGFDWRRFFRVFVVAALLNPIWVLITIFLKESTQSWWTVAAFFTIVPGLIYGTVAGWRKHE